MNKTKIREDSLYKSYFKRVVVKKCAFIICSLFFLSPAIAISATLLAKNNSPVISAKSAIKKLKKGEVKNTLYVNEFYEVTLLVPYSWDYELPRKENGLIILKAPDNISKIRLDIIEFGGKKFPSHPNIDSLVSYLESRPTYSKVMTEKINISDRAGERILFDSKMGEKKKGENGRSFVYLTVKDNYGFILEAKTLLPLFDDVEKNFKTIAASLNFFTTKDELHLIIKKSTSTGKQRNNENKKSSKISEKSAIKNLKKGEVIKSFYVNKYYEAALFIPSSWTYELPRKENELITLRAPDSISKINLEIVEFGSKKFPSAPSIDSIVSYLESRPTYLKGITKKINISGRAGEKILFDSKMGGKKKGENERSFVYLTVKDNYGFILETKTLRPLFDDVEKEFKKVANSLRFISVKDREARKQTIAKKRAEKEAIAKKLAEKEAIAKKRAEEEAIKNAIGATHIITSGDTLGLIALRYTGNGNNWKIIAKFNNIDNPAAITRGQAVRIPKEIFDRDRGPAKKLPELNKKAAPQKISAKESKLEPKKKTAPDTKKNTLLQKVEDKKPEIKKPQKVNESKTAWVYTKEKTDVMKEPGVLSDVLMEVDSNTGLKKIGEQRNWIKVDTEKGEGYIYKDSVRLKK